MWLVPLASGRRRQVQLHERKEIHFDQQLVAVVEERADRCDIVHVFQIVKFNFLVFGCQQLLWYLLLVSGSEAAGVVNKVSRSDAVDADCLPDSLHFIVFDGEQAEKLKLLHRVQQVL